MDPENQGRIKALAAEFPADIVVVLGATDRESISIAAETVTSGDPSYVGPLAGVQLGLPVMHVFDPIVRSQADTDVYDAQVGLIEMTIDTEELVGALEQWQDGEEVA